VVALVAALVVADRAALLVAERRAESRIESGWDASSVDVHLEATSGIVAILTKRWQEARIEASDPEGERDPVETLSLDLDDVSVEERGKNATLTGTAGRARISIPVERMRRSLGPAGRFLEVESGPDGAVAIIDVPFVGTLRTQFDVEDGALVLVLDDLDVLGRDVDVPDELRSTSWPLPIPSTTQMDSVRVDGGLLEIELTFGEFAIDGSGEFVDP
jgi:hypothetical protein